MDSPATGRREPLRLGQVVPGQGEESREALGYEVFTENQNSFRLRGKYATLAGKPDLIAVKGSDAVIIDAKTGRVGPARITPCKGTHRPGVQVVRHHGSGLP